MAGVAALENPLRRRLVHFLFTSSVRVGRFFAETFQCCFSRSEHKLPRVTSSLTGGLVSKRVNGVEFVVSQVAGVPCRIYRPIITNPSVSPINEQQGGGNKGKAASIKLPVVVYIHGGGWTISSARSYHLFTANLARDAGAIVVSVDYQLAPEHPYPAGYEDCLAVVRCILNADTIDPSPFISGRVDTSRVVVAGDSAGGNLSGCVALDLIRANDKRLRGMVLVGPALQAVNFALPSYSSMAPKYALDWFVANYAGVRPTEQVLQAMRRGEHLTPEGWVLRRKYVQPPIDHNDEEASRAAETSPPICSQIIPHKLSELCSNIAAWPLLADDAHLAQLPPTLLQACQYDPMIDENELFANRVRQAGGDIRYVVVENAEHVESVFPHVLKSKAAAEGYNQIVAFIEQSFR